MVVALSQPQHGGRVIASPFVAVSWFHALFDACLSGSTAGLASNATTWCMRRRLASLETAKFHRDLGRARRDDHTRATTLLALYPSIPRCLLLTAVLE